VGKVAFGPMCRVSNYVSVMLETPRSTSGIRSHLKKYDVGEEARRAVEAFEEWRGGFTKDTRENACGLQVEETRGEGFTLCADGSVQKEGDPFSGHAAVGLVRDRDMKLMKVWIRKDQIAANNAFLPEAEAAVFAALVAASLIRQGATSTVCLGDSQSVAGAIKSSTCAESTARVATIRSVIPNVMGWYLARSRRRNHLADYFTHILPRTWGEWVATGERPDQAKEALFVEELFHNRTAARLAILHELPQPSQGPSFLESATFVANQISEDEFYLKCNPYLGRLNMGLGDNVDACFIDAFRLHTQVPRLPILINRWLLGNIITRKRGGIMKEIRKRCVMYMKRDWKNLHFRSAPKIRGGSARNQSKDELLADVVTDVQGGRVGRARRKLNSLGIFDIADPDVQERVRTKYPAKEEFSIPGPIPGWTPMLMTVQFGLAEHVFSSLEYSLDFKLPNGRAPGLSGLTYERLKLMCQAGGRVTLCRYVEELVNGTLPEEVMKFFKAKHVVPLVKKKGSHDVRPIGVGDCLRRWAAIAIGVEILGHREYWPPSDLKGKLSGQYGVGVRAGAETMFRVAECYQARYPRRVIVKADAMNGYNAIRRSTIWEGVIQLGIASLQRYMATFYFGASLVVDGAGLFKLLQWMGVDQGDPLGPLLFSIGIWILCRDIMAENPNIIFTFYIDDLLMMGEGLDLMNIIREVREALAEGNLLLSMESAKQEVFCPAEVKPEGYKDLCEELGAKLGATGMTILGIPCGSEEFIREEAKVIAAKYEKELTTLLPLAQSYPKHALAIYRTCSIPTFNYFLRSISPQYMGEVETEVREWDQALLLHMLRRPCLDTDITQDSRRWLLAGLPVSMGGFGSRDVTLVGRAAYMAAWGDCLASQARGDSEIASGLAWVWRCQAGKESYVYKGLQRCMTTLRQYAGGLIAIGPSVQATVETLANYSELDDPRPIQVGTPAPEGGREGDDINRARLQKSLTSAIYKTIWNGLLSEINPANAQMQATMLANTGGAICNGWVTNFDADGASVENAFLKRRGATVAGFSADEWRAAAQIRLCLSDPFLNACLEKFSLVMCHCTRRLSANGWYHFLSCEKCGYNERHDALVRAIIKFARAAGMLVRGDKQSPPLGPEMKKADFEICIGPKTLVYDVRVVSALSECYSKSLLARVHPVSFGDSDQQFWDFMVARDYGAALHMARYGKIREYAPGWKPTELAYEPLEKNQDPIPEERRLLKHVVISDLSRGPVDLIPLVFQIGGSAAPEVGALVKDLVEAAVEASPLQGPFVYAAFHNELTSSMSNKLMRAAARNILRMRQVLSCGEEKHLVRVPDRAVDAPLAVLPTNWIPFASPLFQASESVLQLVTPPPELRTIPPSRRGRVKVHMVARVDPPQVPMVPPAPVRASAPTFSILSTLTPTTISSFTSSSLGPS
jgi:hypothetical protein